MYDTESSQFVVCFKCGAILPIYVSNPVLGEYYCDLCMSILT